MFLIIRPCDLPNFPDPCLVLRQPLSSIVCKSKLLIIWGRMASRGAMTGKVLGTRLRSPVPVLNLLGEIIPVVEVVMDLTTGVSIMVAMIITTWNA